LESSEYDAFLGSLLSKPLILSVPAAGYSRNASCSLLSKLLFDFERTAGTLKIKQKFGK
jgi:hypothetical protein